jgi:hypothetical protein
MVTPKVAARILGLLIRIRRVLQKSIIELGAGFGIAVVALPGVVAGVVAGIVVKVGATAVHTLLS